MSSTTRPRPTYVVEHMEEDDPSAPAVFPTWALLEYRQMLRLVGSGGSVWFTSLSSASLSSLRSELEKDSDAKDRAAPRLCTEGILTLSQKEGIPLSSICLLDPRAVDSLSVADAGLYDRPSTSTLPIPSSSQLGPFTHFLFGGILGDDPPRDRTSSLRALGFPHRHLGKVQMTTDTALGVTKRVVEDGMALAFDGEEVEQEGPKGRLTWVREPELKFGGGESVTMPFRYMAEDPSAKPLKPLLPPGMREHIKADLDRSFDDF